MAQQPKQMIFESSKLRAPSAVADVLASIVNRYGLTTQFAQARLEERWADLVGEPIARVTRILSTEMGILTIAVSSSSWRQSLQLEQDALLQKVQSDPSGKKITKLRFVHDLHANTRKNEPASLPQSHTQQSHRSNTEGQE